MVVIVVEMDGFAWMVEVVAIVDVVFHEVSWTKTDAGTIPVEWVPRILELEAVVGWGEWVGVYADAYDLSSVGIGHVEYLDGVALGGVWHLGNAEEAMIVIAVFWCVGELPGAYALSAVGYVVFFKEPANLIRHIAW